MNKCKTCGKVIPPFSPSSNYCSQKCEDSYESKSGVVQQLMDMLRLR